MIFNEKKCVLLKAETYRLQWLIGNFSLILHTIQNSEHTSMDIYIPKFDFFCQEYLIDLFKYLLILNSVSPPPRL